MQNDNVPISDEKLRRSGIHPERLRKLNEADLHHGEYVLYWMQASQREKFNPALEFSIMLSNAYKTPLLVCFVITDNYPEANLRHYQFMIEGLFVTTRKLRKRGMAVKILSGSGVEIICGLAKRSSALVMDYGYTRHQVEWRIKVADKIHCPAYQVEGDIIVPVESASDHEEYAARTIRPKIMKRIDEFMLPLKRNRIMNKAEGTMSDTTMLDDIDSTLDRLKIDKTIAVSSTFVGGEDHAHRRLTKFINNGLQRYNTRNDPNQFSTSRLSPYLHFGQISPVEIALEILNSGSKNADAFIEQLTVRRELAINFTFFNDRYSSYKCLPDWARKTLARHVNDKREYIYNISSLESAATHDRAWNAAQQEMLKTGYMENYMRMYWGKKILEWSPTPEAAFETALQLNNKYQLDGRDPNSFAGIAWCFGKHDRPWSERNIFGNIRYMNENGLRRKFDIEAYINRIKNI